MSMFGRRLRTLLEEHDMEGKDFAKAMHVQPPTVSNWMNGNRFPKEDVLLNIASFFNVTTDYLLGISDLKNPSNINLNISLSNLLKKAIGDKDIYEFSKLTNIKKSIIKDLLNGNNDIVNPDMLKRIANVSNDVTYEELLEVSGHKQKEKVRQNTENDIKEAEDFSHKLLVLLKEEGLIDDINSVTSDKVKFITDMLESYFINTNNHRKYKKED